MMLELKRKIIQITQRFKRIIHRNITTYSALLKEQFCPCELAQRDGSELAKAITVVKVCVNQNKWLCLVELA